MRTLREIAANLPANRADGVRELRELATAHDAEVAAWRQRAEKAEVRVAELEAALAPGAVKREICAVSAIPAAEDPQAEESPLENEQSVSDAQPCRTFGCTNVVAAGRAVCAPCHRLLAVESGCIEFDARLEEQGGALEAIAEKVAARIVIEAAVLAAEEFDKRWGSPALPHTAIVAARQIDAKYGVEVPELL